MQAWTPKVMFRRDVDGRNRLYTVFWAVRNTSILKNWKPKIKSTKFGWKNASLMLDVCNSQYASFDEIEKEYFTRLRLLRKLCM
jgi:hypothetical protein